MKCKYYPERECDTCYDIKEYICCKDCIRLAICEDICSYWKEYVKEVTNANK